MITWTLQACTCTSVADEVIELKRRDFITALAGATACISAGRAQEPRRVIGFLTSIAFGSYLGGDAAIARGLENTGFVEDKNISIIRRSADGQYNRLPSLASELVALHTDYDSLSMGQRISDWQG